MSESCFFFLLHSAGEEQMKWKKQKARALAAPVHGQLKGPDLNIL